MSQQLEQLLCHSTLNANNNTNTVTTSWQEHFIYTTPITSYTNKVKIGKKGRGNVNLCVSSDEI